MFDVGAPELLVIAIVAIVVVGPKDLPRLLRTVGQWVGKARRATQHFRSGIDAMIREAELEEMQKKWDAENAAIMRAHPMPEATPTEELPADSAPEPKPEAPPAS